MSAIKIMEVSLVRREFGGGVKKAEGNGGGAT